MTSYFIRTWLYWLAAFGLLLIAERTLLGMTWSFFLIGQLTVLLFIALTCSMYADWRSASRSRRCTCVTPDRYRRG